VFESAELRPVSVKFDHSLLLRPLFKINIRVRMSSVTVKLVETIKKKVLKIYIPL